VQAFFAGQLDQAGRARIGDKRLDGVAKLALGRLGRLSNWRLAALVKSML